MDNGKFVYSKPGSNEVIGEAVIRTGYHKLARIYLSRGGVRNPDAEMVGYLAAFIAGEREGIEGIEVGDPRKVTEEKIALLMCDFDVDIVMPDAAPVEPDSVVDENPTVTSGDFS